MAIEWEAVSPKTHTRLGQKGPYFDGLLNEMLLFGFRSFG
jgi:hypothetical protein